MVRITVYIQPEDNLLGSKEALLNALEAFGWVERVEISGAELVQEKLKLPAGRQG